MIERELRKVYRTKYEDIKRQSDEVDKLKAQLGQVGDTEQKRRLSRLDRLHLKQINLELKAIEANELATDAEQKVIETQLKHIRDAYDEELTGFRELFGTSGEATVRDVALDILQQPARFSAP